MKRRRKKLCLDAALLALLALLVAACGPNVPSVAPTPVPSAATEVAPTAVPPAATQIPPTPAPPTATQIPPTPAPPTATQIPPTPAPPKATQIPPTPAPPTATPVRVSITVTFTGDTCTMEGPQEAPEGAVLVIHWTLEETNYALPGLCLLTVDEGKTLADLQAAPGYPQPSWVHLTYGDCWPMEYGLTSTSVQAVMKTGPVYIGCFASETRKIGVLGPIEVVQ